MAGGVQVSHRAALRVGHRAVFGHVERRGRTCRSSSIQDTVVEYCGQESGVRWCPDVAVGGRGQHTDG